MSDDTQPKMPYVVFHDPELYTALALAQAEMPNAVLNKVNPHFHSRYADLASIREATLPSLTKNGLSILQYTMLIGDKLELRTRLSHKSGQWIEGSYPIALDRPQAMGSALTYARRYNWAGMCGVGFEEDDDAEEASREKPAKKGKADARPDYTVMAGDADIAETRAELETIWRQHRDLYDAMPDDWKKHIRDHYARVKESLPE